MLKTYKFLLIFCIFNSATTHTAGHFFSTCQQAINRLSNAIKQNPQSTASNVKINLFKHEITLLTEALLKNNIEQLNKTDELGQTLLIKAAHNNDFNATQLLLKNGADPNTQDNMPMFKMTSLHWAVRNGNLKIMNLLLNHPNINTTIKDATGENAREYAITIQASSGVINALTIKQVEQEIISELQQAIIASCYKYRRPQT